MIDPTKKQLKAISDYKKDLAFLIEVAETQARLQKARYDAYVNAGFTPEQAIELCKAPLSG